MTYRESGPANDTILDEGWARGEIEKAVTPEGALYPDAAEVRKETEERLQDLSEEELAELSGLVRTDVLALFGLVGAEKVTPAQDDNEPAEADHQTVMAA